MPGQRAATVLAALLLCCCAGAAPAAVPPACKPQGLLRLDKPYAPPYRASLPFCDKYRCSCCNASHALAVQRSLQPLLLDEELSRACMAALAMMACRVCDPEVGVGNKTAVCSYTCQQVFEACMQDYFAFDEASGSISPCAASQQRGGMLVCSQLSEVADGGTAFCRAAGYTPASGDEPCFAGEGVPGDACAEAPARPPRGSSRAAAGRGSSSSRSSSWPPWWLKRRHKRQLLAAAQTLLGAVLSAAMALGVVALLQRVMAQAPRRAPAAAPANAREVLAKAAEARSRRGRGG